MGLSPVSVLPVHAGATSTSVEGSMLLLGVVTLACLGTGVLFAVSFLAYWQRRSTRYLLIAVAVGALFMRSLVGIGTVLGYTPMGVHHLLEHSFDFLIAALVLYAVLRSGPTDPEGAVDLSTDGGERREPDEEN